MASDTDKKQADIGLTVLAVFCWILPFAGFVWGPGSWWVYLLWLIAGTGVIFLYDRVSDHG